MYKSLPRGDAQGNHFFLSFFPCFFFLTKHKEHLKARESNPALAGPRTGTEPENFAVLKEGVFSGRYIFKKTKPGRLIM